MKRFNLYLAILLGFSMVLTGCFDDPGTDIVWEGSYVEIQEATTAAGSTISRAYAQQPNGVGTPVRLRVNLSSAALNNPVTVNFEFSGSAIEGVHYNKVTSGNSVTIPAGEFYAYIDYEVLTFNFGTDEAQTITVTLTGASDGVELSNYATLTTNTRKECSFSIANFVGSYSCIEPGYGGSPYDVTFTEIDATTVEIDNFWDFGGVAQYEFDASGGVTLPEQTIQMGGEGWVVAGSGTYDPCTGSFSVDYTVVRVSDGLTYDDNTHTFNRN
ncbi:hypothetical protein [Fulvivirga sedimenti]|uniref:DUF1735 domain-containing protein n=1 Tax=Fulvivirga sedimenti TaxID=2879465 RepID=A0A9X1HV33_9BACT|nr:hypothetical protein [Fulvivirga sedimenti]MCA6077905.1 hypothetical protein [Fulvivirga sedimenti]